MNVLPGRGQCLYSLRPATSRPEWSSRPNRSFELSESAILFLLGI